MIWGVSEGRGGGDDIPKILAIALVRSEGRLITSVRDVDTPKMLVIPSILEGGGEDPPKILAIALFLEGGGVGIPKILVIPSILEGRGEDTPKILRIAFLLEDDTFFTSFLEGRAPRSRFRRAFTI